MEAEMKRKWNLFYWGCTANPCGVVEAVDKDEAKSLGFKMFGRAVDAEIDWEEYNAYFQRI
jgi:hypothetical protein